MAYILFNEDGTRYQPPEIEPYKKLITERFPPCKYGASYQCMFCGKCPSGDYFKWPAECIPIVEAQQLAVKHYTNQHNNIGQNGLYLKDVEL